MPVSTEVIEREYRGFKIRPSLSGLYAVAYAEGGATPSSVTGHYTGVDFAMAAIDVYLADRQEKMETTNQKQRTLRKPGVE